MPSSPLKVNCPAPGSFLWKHEDVVNQNKMSLGEAACLALCKGLNYAVTSTILPVEDILCGMETGIGVLPE
jgi:hypothetical protein